MDKIEKIRAEIDRRYAYQKEMYSKTKPDGRPNDGWAESLAIMGELEELRDFLDALSEEPAPKGYDEAYLNEKIAKASKTWEGVDVDKYMDEVRGREFDMYDPQYLDMNYERYYFIPWPDSQLFEEEDPEKEFIVPVEGGVFLSMEWLNKNE